jgi:predicted RNA-binding Zn ribbon-like protein
MLPYSSTSIGKKPIAGEICLDFANSVEWHASDEPRETLNSYENLVSWCRRAGLLDDSGAKTLLRESHKHPRRAQAVLKRVITLREVIYRLILATVNEQALNPSDLDTFNRSLQGILSQLRVVPEGGHFDWYWVGIERDLDGMLGPILGSAAALLTSDQLGRIGVCADDRGCGWLFLDTSKNRSRKWCQMRDCGNRAKARRHYRRRRERDLDRGIRPPT